MDENSVRQIVRRVVLRTLGSRSGDATSTLHPIASSPNAVATRDIVSEAQVRDLPFGSELVIADNALITPLAQQVAMDRRITLRRESTAPPPSSEPTTSVSQAESRGQLGPVAVGADHGGFELKETLKSHLADLGYAVIDCGTNSNSSVDYPDFAYAVAKLVSAGTATRGIIVDGAGIGSCMAANKVPGVLAAMCYDHATAVNSREHNHANVLTLGAGLLGTGLARQIVTTWLNTAAGSGRHERRVNLIRQIESRYLNRTVED